MSETLEMTAVCQECGNYMDILIYDSSNSECPTYICPECNITYKEE